MLSCCSVVFVTVKYLGLMAMSKILRTHPKSVQAHKDLILQCLDDKDESIRLRALDLLYGMVSSSSCKCKCKSWIYIAHYVKNTSNALVL